MFFDAPKKDGELAELLKAVAKKQKELFDAVYGSNSFDGKASELEALKDRLRQRLEEKGYRRGIYWWKLPWRDVLEALYNDLDPSPEEKGGWRVERSLRCERKDDNILIYLEEEGHLTILSQDYNAHSYEEESVYSAEERSSMVKSYNDRRNKEAFWNSLLIDGPVYSLDTYKTYSSAADYYTSLDYYFHRKWASDRYARSLYTEHITQEISITSHSKHYSAVYALGLLKVSPRGEAEYLAVRNYEMLDVRGDVPPWVGADLIKRDAAAACAAFLAESELVTSVPIELFGKNMERGATTYDEAMEQAKLYTCLAEKIV